MSRSPGPTEDAWTGPTREASGAPGRDLPSTPEVPPPAVDAADPVAPLTHEDGGTYAPGDYSAAARRSQAHRDQLEPPPGPDAGRAQRSGFAEAEGREGPASVAGGH